MDELRYILQDFHQIRSHLRKHFLNKNLMIQYKNFLFASRLS